MSFKSCLLYFEHAIKMILGMCLVCLFMVTAMIPLEKFLTPKRPSFFNTIFSNVVRLLFSISSFFVFSKYVFPYFSSKTTPYIFVEKSNELVQKNIEPVLQTTWQVGDVNRSSHAINNSLKTAVNKFFLENKHVKIEISSQGGDITNFELKEHFKTRDSSEFIALSNLLQMHSGWKLSAANSFEQLPETLEFISNGVVSQDTLSHSLSSYFSNHDLNLKFTKEWSLTPDSYFPMLTLSWQNISENFLQNTDSAPKFLISEFCEFKIPENFSKESLELLQTQQIDVPKIVSFSKNKHFNSLDIQKNVGKKFSNVERTEQGWLGVSTAPFLSAIFPTKDKHALSFHQYRILDPVKHQYRVGFESIAVSFDEPSHNTSTFAIFFGPMDPKFLAEIAPQLELALDHGSILWPLRSLFLIILKYLYSIFKNWGWALLFAALGLQLILSAPFIKASIDLERRIQTMPQKFQNYQALKDAQTKAEQTKTFFQAGYMVISCLLLWSIRPLILYSIHFRHQPFLMQFNDLSASDSSGLLILTLMALQKISKLDRFAMSPIINPSSPIKTVSVLSKTIGIVLVALLLLFRNYVYPFVFWKAAMASIVLHWVLNENYTKTSSKFALKKFLNYPWHQVAFECFNNFILLEVMTRFSIGWIILFLANALADVGRNLFSAAVLYFIED